jgi:hypothetical protein
MTLDAQGRTMMARLSIDKGNEYPFDAPDSWWDARSPTPPNDWAHSAARGILIDLQDRGGIKHALYELDEEVRAEIVSAIANIIREALP